MTFLNLVFVVEVKLASATKLKLTKRNNLQLSVNLKIFISTNSTRLKFKYLWQLKYYTDGPGRKSVTTGFTAGSFCHQRDSFFILHVLVINVYFG